MVLDYVHKVLPELVREHGRGDVHGEAAKEVFGHIAKKGHFP